MSFPALEVSEAYTKDKFEPLRSPLRQKLISEETNELHKKLAAI